MTVDWRLIITRLKWARRKYLRRGFVRHYFGGLYHRIDDDHIFLSASGLAFSLFVCVIPLVLIIFYALGAVLERPAIKSDIDVFIDHAIPYEEYALYIKELVYSRVDEFVANKNVAGVIGLIGLLIASTSLFSSMRTILNRVYRIPVAESIFVSKLRDVGLVALVLFYFLISTAVLPALEIIDGFSDQFAILHGFKELFMEGAGIPILSYLLICATFAIIYTTVPHRRLPAKVVWLSALWAALLWLLAQQVFGFYITHFITFKRIYGAYAFMLAVGFWVFYTSIVLILGAEIGQLYRERKEELDVSLPSE